MYQYVFIIHNVDIILAVPITLLINVYKNINLIFENKYYFHNHIHFIHNQEEFTFVIKDNNYFHLIP